MTVQRILAVCIVTSIAALVVAGCGFIPNPTVGEPAEPPPTTAAPGAATPAPQATQITDTGSASSESGASTPEIVVNQGHSVKQWPSPPPMTIDPASSYTAVLNTSAGTITVELLAGEAPSTVNNFVFLAQQGFYKQRNFSPHHRGVYDPGRRSHRHGRRRARIPASPTRWFSGPTHGA